MTRGMGSPRIADGEEALQYFTFFAPHTAGVYQQVSGLSAGAELRFVTQAHVWVSSGSDFDTSDPGANLTVEVGIDPTGGTDWQSNTIVWSSPATSYDGYTEFSVEATAQGETATVFVRSVVAADAVFMNNVVYLDAAVLTADGGQQSVIEAATPEVTPEPPVVEAVTPEATPEVTPKQPPVVEPTVEAVVVTVLPTVSAVELTVVQATVMPTVAMPEPTPVPGEDMLIPEATPALRRYVVQYGDTLSGIAARFGTTTRELARLNNVVNPNLIFAGQVLRIPTADGDMNEGVQQPVRETYIVLPGDTLYWVAVRFGVTMNDLIRLNGIANPNRIFVGQRLVIR